MAHQQCSDCLRTVYMDDDRETDYPDATGLCSSCAEERRRQEEDYWDD